MTVTGPLTPPDPADEPVPAAEEAPHIPPRPRRYGPAADVLQALRYMTATPLVITTLWLDVVSETFREAAQAMARLSNRIEGGPR